MAAMLCIAGCGGKTIRAESPANGPAGGGEDAERLLGYVRAINESAPASIEAQFYINGKAKKKFKSQGEIQYSREAGRMMIAVTDVIFRSPLLYFFQSDAVLKFYFPVDKKLFIDSIDTINLKNYTEYNIDFPVVYDIIRGAIPLIGDYRIKKVQPAAGTAGTFLVLENDDSFETISFNGEWPDKILLIRKSTGERYEAYFEKYIRNTDTHYFKNLVLVAPQADVRIELQVSRHRLNAPVTVKSLQDFKLRKDLQIIHMAPGGVE